ncbi:MAG: hypothetical protein KAI22_06215 [Gammaproteobacteria bacterium]|nr:hypothetical protein [Gammaproteobacteria bacterium]
MLIHTSFYKNPISIKQAVQLLVSCLCLLFISDVLYADKSFIKCWKNAEGLTECGNRVPREYYNQRIRYVDDRGITRKIKEKTKTREELDAQIEMEKLRSLEEKQKRQLKEYDDVLLKTYLTIDDLLASLNSKLLIIDSRGTIIDSNIELKKRQFGNLVRKASNMERSGKTISDKLARQLDTARRELKNIQVQLDNQAVETNTIKKVFAHDVERFMLAKFNRIKHTITTPSQAKKLHAVRLNCLNQDQCKLHWKKANQFIKEFATSAVLYTTDKVTVTDIPVQYQDIAMSLAILNKNNSNEKKLMIFQIRCNRERAGQEFCASEDINGLLKEFKSIVYQQ